MFGKRVKEMRKAKKLTQTELAKLLDTSKTTISGWENESYLPSVKMLIALCKVLETSSDYLLGLDDVPTLNLEGIGSEEVKQLRTLVDILKSTNN